ncbi:unnamed protein product, partial [Ectocarpus sp. 4 AP-2014]
RGHACFTVGTSSYPGLPTSDKTDPRATGGRSGKLRQRRRQLEGGRHQHRNVAAPGIRRLLARETAVTSACSLDRLWLTSCRSWTQKGARDFVGGLYRSRG